MSAQQKATDFPDAQAPTLNDLAQRLFDSRIALNRARLDLADLENQIILAAGFNGRGMNSVKTEHFNIVLSSGDEPAIEPAGVCSLRCVIPSEIHDQLFDWHPTVNQTALRFLRLNEPEIFATVSKHIKKSPLKSVLTANPV